MSKSNHIHDRLIVMVLYMRGNECALYTGIINNAITEIVNKDDIKS